MTDEDVELDPIRSILLEKSIKIDQKVEIMSQMVRFTFLDFTGRDNKGRTVIDEIISMNEFETFKNVILFCSNNKSVKINL